MFGGGCLVPADLSAGATRRELVGQRRPAPGDPRPHRPGWDVEDAGDLRVVEPDQISERDRGAMARGQARERGVDVDLVGDGVFEARPPFAWLRERLRGSRPARSAPRFVEGGVGGDPVAPRRELRASVEGVDAPRDREQRVLRGVERVVGVARAPGGRPRESTRRAGAAARRARHGHPLAAAAASTSSRSSAFTRRNATYRPGPTEPPSRRPTPAVSRRARSRSIRRHAGPTWTPTTGPMWPDDDLGAGHLRAARSVEELVEVGGAGVHHADRLDLAVRASGRA